MRFGIGQKVKIKTLEEILEIEGVKEYGDVENPGIVNDMLIHLGTYGVIVDKTCFGNPSVEVGSGKSSDRWAFKESWLEDIKKKPIKEKKEPNIIEKTDHYNVDPNFEVIKALKAWLTKEEFIGFCKGNVIKYNVRALHKGDPETDYKKAEYYQKQINNY